MDIFKNLIHFFSHYIHLEFFTRLILFSSFVVTFLTIFFFTFGEYMEKKMVMQNIDYLIDDAFNGITNILGDKYNKYFYDKLNEVKLDDMSKEDKEVQDNNDKLFKLSMYILIGYLSAAIIISALISYIKKYNYFKIFSENIILLIFIGMCEFVFLIFFGSQFISANNNFIKGTIASYLYNPNASGEPIDLVKDYFKTHDDNNLSKYINEHPDEVDELFDIFKSNMFT